MTTVSTTPTPSMCGSITPRATAAPCASARARVAPLNHPHSKVRYTALTRAHVHEVAELDEQAGRLLDGFAAVHGWAEGTLRATAAWILLEMLEAHFEVTNELSAARYDTICAWEPDNGAVLAWADAMEDAYLLTLPDDMRESKLAALAAMTTTFRDGGNTAAPARRRLFGALVARLRADPGADTPRFYENVCRSARDEFLGELHASATARDAAAGDAEESGARDEYSELSRQGEGQEVVWRRDLDTLYETSMEWRDEESRRQSIELERCAEEIAAMERFVRELAGESVQ